MPMKRLEQFGEMKELLSWIGAPARHPGQTHGLNESDCECVDLGNGTYLAATIDSLSEEMAYGLYKDPYTVGWVAAMASLSDLSAVGARPIGMLLGAEWGAQTEPAYKARVAEGFSAALARCGAFWLGGDSGQTRSTVLSGVGLGLCDSRPLSRVGMRPGDALVATGPVGMGAALAYRFLLEAPESDLPESSYRPVARIDAGIALRGLASAAMDTSDGVLSTVDTLALLNGSALELEWVPGLLSEPARNFCEKHGLPQWMLWAAEHGDYGLIAAVPEKNLEKAMASLPGLTRIGRVAGGENSSLRLPDGKKVALDLAFARSLLNAGRKNPKEAVAALIRHAKENGLP